VSATLAALPLLEGGNASWQWNPGLAIVSVVAAILVGLVASLQPAIRASRYVPAVLNQAKRFERFNMDTI
jgi:ABC-type antimicrobial peptide transport system permease subunit